MSEKLKIHDGDTPGKTFEVKPEYPQPKVVTMSKELVCPFCQHKLEPIGTSGQFQCGSLGCKASFNFYATRDVWEYIDRTRKALDVAVDALNKIDKQLMTGIEMTCQARNALEQITALEQKDKKCGKTPQQL